MHPAQTLDFQADLYHRTTQDAVREVIINHFVTDMRVWLGVDQATRSANAIVNAIPNGLKVASAYYVEPDMTDLVVGASAVMDETDVFRYDELPTEAGFAYFEKPLVIGDVRGVDLNVNGVIWFSSRLYDQDTKKERSGTVIVMLNDQFHTPDEIAKSIMRGDDKLLSYDVYRANLGRWGIIGFEMLWDGLQIGPAVVEADTSKYEELVDEGIMPSEFTNIRRQLHSFWLMLGQTITKVSDSEIPRPFARRAKKARLPARVTVIRLRRHNRAEGGVGDTAVEWSHRWWSRGHWRWQPVSAHHPMAEPDGSGGWKARIYVHGSIKGPEGKPLVISQKVYSLVE